MIVHETCMLFLGFELSVLLLAVPCSVRERGCDKMVNHFVAASFLRLYFIIFSSAVSLLRKNARKPPYPHKTFNYIVLGGNPYTHYFGSSRFFVG